MRPDGHRTLAADTKLIPWLLLAAFATPLAAAPQVYADPAGTCNGLTPCFTTVTQAVANAGPAPANVGLFPGTYAEAVDLSTMGSAIAGTPGALTVEALDASGQPAVTGVTISPPTGVALTTGLGTPWPSDLTLRGLIVTSPDSTNLGLITNGDLFLADIVAENSPQIGAVAIAEGNLTAERVTVRLNGANGLAAAAMGQATLTDIVADQNGGTGVAALGELGLRLDTVTATSNGDGLQAASCNALEVAELTIDGSTLTGGTLEAGTPNCQFMNVRNDAAFKGFPLPKVSGRGAGGGNPSVNALNVVSENNGDYGLGVISPSGPVSLESVFAYDNVSVGIGIEATTLVLDDVEGSGNRTGIFAQADSISGVRVIANDSLPMPSNPPVGGSGLVVITGNAALNDIQADNNPEIGLLVFQPAPGAPVTVDLVDSQFDGNRIGVAADADVPITFSADTVFVENQTTAGMLLSNLGEAELARLEFTGNALGLLLDVAGTARVERSLFTGNDAGVALTLAPFAQAAVVCSDFVTNTAGIQLGQGDAANASANYWGAPSGPTHPGNPGGSGDSVVDGANGGTGTVLYTPFLTAPATDADCPAAFPEPTAVPTLGQAGRSLLLLSMVLVGLLAVRLRAH